MARPLLQSSSGQPDWLESRPQQQPAHKTGATVARFLSFLLILTTGSTVRLLGAIVAIALSQTGCGGLIQGNSLSNRQAIKLPIEVMGAGGTTVSATAKVPASAAAQVTGLWMQVHGLSYPDKASVQVNDGAWVPLNNSSVQVAEPGKSYGGIGGSFATLKLTLPLPAGSVVAGTNTLRFRLNFTDKVSIGFRVVKLNFTDAQGNKILPSSAFTEENPDNWQAPLASDADRAEGERLWRTAQLISTPALVLFRPAAWTATLKMAAT